MTIGSTYTEGPLLEGSPRWFVSRTWSGADKDSTGGLLLPHEYLMDGVQRHNGELRYLWNQKLYTVAWMLGMGTDAPDPVWTASDELKLLGKLADRIRGHDFNAGVALGTGAQTANLLADSAYRLAQGLRSLKRGDAVGDIVDALKKARGGKLQPPRREPRPTDNRGTVREMSQAWLEASYGWSPLLADAYAAGEALAKHVSNARRMSFRVSHSVKTSVDLRDTISLTKASKKRTVTLHYEAKSESELPSEWDCAGLTNPATVAWELVPWSFVVDWFLPVGSFLELQTMIPRLTGTWWRSDVRRDLLVRSPNAPASFVAISPLTRRATALRRSKGVGGIQVPFPSFKSPFSKDWRRLANAVALLGALK